MFIKTKPIRLIMALLATIMLVTMLLADIGARYVSAAQSQQPDYVAIYRQHLQEIFVEQFTVDPYFSAIAPVEFTFSDMNNDGIPELFHWQRYDSNTLLAAYTITNGQVIKLGNSSLMGVSPHSVVARDGSNVPVMLISHSPDFSGTGADDAVSQLGELSMSGYELVFTPKFESVGYLTSFESSLEGENTYYSMPDRTQISADECMAQVAEYNASFYELPDNNGDYMLSLFWYEFEGYSDIDMERLELLNTGSGTGEEAMAYIQDIAQELTNGASKDILLEAINQANLDTFIAAAIESESETPDAAPVPQDSTPQSGYKDIYSEQIKITLTEDMDEVLYYHQRPGSFTLSDMDSDGIPELFYWVITEEAIYLRKAYTIIDNKAVALTIDSTAISSLGIAVQSESGAPVMLTSRIGATGNENTSQYGTLSMSGHTLVFTPKFESTGEVFTAFTSWDNSNTYYALPDRSPLSAAECEVLVSDYQASFAALPGQNGAYVMPLFIIGGRVFGGHSDIMGMKKIAMVKSRYDSSVGISGLVGKILGGATADIITDAIDENNVDVFLDGFPASMAYDTGDFIRRFEVNNEVMTYAEAEAYCQSLGGYMAEIDSSAELRYVESLVNSYGFQGQREYMVGALPSGQTETELDESLGESLALTTDIGVSGGFVIEWNTIGTSGYYPDMKWEVYGVPFVQPAYDFRGMLCVSIEDLAIVLSESAAEFAFERDELTRNVYMTSGADYLGDTGNALGLPTSMAGYYQSNTVYMLDGERLTKTVHDVFDYEFFRLRDLEDVFGFSVNYDAANSTIHITTPGIPDDYVWFDGDSTDTDGDGIPNTWEVNGVPLGNGTVMNLQEMGAHPNIPDIFVEVDWMVDKSSPALLKSYAPGVHTLRPVFDIFRKHGIQLHIDAGENSFDYVTGKKWSDYSSGSGANSLIHYPVVYSSDEYQGRQDFWDYIVEHNFTPSRRDVFHHSVFVENIEFEGKNGSSGLGNIGGLNFLVVNQDWIRNLDEYGVSKMARCFMHELGHNLTLRHGGTDNINEKPDYYSVMNYKYDYDGIRMNYSDAKQPQAYDDWGNIVLNGGESLGVGGLEAPQTVEQVDPTACLSLDYLLENKMLGEAGDCNVVELAPVRIPANNTDQKFYLKIMNFAHEDAHFEIDVDGRKIAQGFSTEVNLDASIKEIGYKIVEVPLNDNLAPGEYDITCTLYYKGRESLMRNLPVTVYDFNESELAEIKDSIESGAFSEIVSVEIVGQFAELTDATVPVSGLLINIRRYAILGIVLLTAMIIFIAVPKKSKKK